MPYNVDLPSTVLEFFPDPKHASGLARADESVLVRLSVDEDGYVIEGSYSILYVASVMTVFDADVPLRVAVKVFKDPVFEDDAFREHEMLNALGGLDGFLPRAVAFGHVLEGGDVRGRPAIMQEFISGESVMVCALALWERFPEPRERLEEVLKMVRAITAAVAAINDTAEVRHGDLSHTNVMLVRHGVRGYKAVLIDLGQATPKQSPVPPGVPRTDFFSAPELFGGGMPWHEGEYAKGRSSADVYSIGALWVYLLLRGTYTSDDDFLNGYHEALESWSNGVARWASPAGIDDALLSSTVGSLIASCMRQEPSDRRSLSDIIDDLRNLCTPQLRTEACLTGMLVSSNGIHVLGDVLPSPYPIRPSLHVAGRDAELAQVARCLREGRVAYVCGFGGIGKSTIATAFATEALAEGGCHGVRVKRVYLLPFVSSVAETLAGVASKLTDRRFGGRGMDEAAEWALDVMEGALWPDDLVILDDVFSPGQTLMDVAGNLLNRMARNGRYKLIVTSRYPAAGDVAGHVVHTYGLGDASLAEVFRTQAGTSGFDDALLARLFAAVDRNTLVVKLVGGLVGGGLIDLEEVVEVLEAGRLGNEVIDAHTVANCDDGVQANIRGHVARLLSLTIDALTAQERDLMSRLLLLPRQGVGVKCLGQAIRRERPDLACAFATLRDKGLVERMPQGTRVRLHTLVRSVCLEAGEFTPPLDPSEGFLQELIRMAQDALDVGNLAVVLDAEAILRCAADLARRQGPDSFVDTLLRRRAEVLRELGRTAERLLVTEELLERVTSRLADGDAGVADEGIFAWARAMADHSEALTDAGRYHEAIDQANEALSVLKWNAGSQTSATTLAELPGTQRTLVARLLASRGAAVQELSSRGLWKDVRVALYDKQQAFSIIDETGDEWETATSLITLAYTEYHAGERDRAIRDAERAIALVTSSRHQPERERDLLRATCINYLGFFLCNGDDCVEGRLGESLALKEEAIRIRYRYLPPIHIDIARSHNNVAYSLRHLGNANHDRAMQRAALDHALVARRIRDELRGDGREVSMTLVNGNIKAMMVEMGLEQREVGERLAGLGIPAGYWRM